MAPIACFLKCSCNLIWHFVLFVYLFFALFKELPTKKTKLVAEVHQQLLVVS